MALTGKGLIEKNGGSGGSGGSCTFDGVYTQPSGNVSGTSCQDWVDLHFATQPPVAHINSVVPNCQLREKGDLITNPVIQFSATQGANGAPLDKIKIKRNGTLIYTENAATYGTIYTFNDTYNTDTVDTAYKVIARDTGARNNNVTCDYTFVYPYYMGVGAQGLTPAQIYSQIPKTIMTKQDRDESYTTSNQVGYYAYPASYGVLSDIFDENDFNVTNDWALRVENLTGLDGTSQSYNIYEFKNITSTTMLYKFRV